MKFVLLASFLIGAVYGMVVLRALFGPATAQLTILALILGLLLWDRTCSRA